MVVGIARKLSVLQNPAYRPTHCFYSPTRRDQNATELEYCLIIQSKGSMSIFIIAEIGINHNGSLDICKQLIDLAVRAGADAVKFQKRTLELVCTKEILDSPRKSPGGTTQRDQKQGLELDLDDKDANLCRIGTLRDTYNCDVGNSGHETGVAISYGAVGHGISSLERHTTLNRAMYGSDQAASLEPVSFVSLLGGIRKIENVHGDGSIGMNPKEKSVAGKLRAHLPKK